MKSTFITVRLREEDVAVIREMANKSRTSISAVVHGLLEEHQSREDLTHTVETWMSRLDKLIRTHLSICQEILYNDRISDDKK